MSKEKGRFAKLWHFLSVDLWRIRVDDLPRLRSFGLLQLRVLVLSVRGFIQDKCPLRASALTYYSVLSVVPFVAMAFAIAKGFGFEEILKTQFIEAMEGNEEVATWIIKFSEKMLEKAKGGVIAGLGIAVLLWSVIKVLWQVEEAFNTIWAIQKSRSYIRKFTDYVTIMLFCPILFAAASTANVLVAEKLTFLNELTPILSVLASLVPILLTWLLFALLYMIFPNTSVKLKAVILPAILAGTAFHIVQWLYIKTQLFITSYSAIYLSFAALPLFLVWLQVSWTVILLGAEFSFAYQNVRTFEFEPDSMRASQLFRKRLAVFIMLVVVKRFDVKKPPLTSQQIAKKVNSPVRLVRKVLQKLVDARMLSEVGTEEQDVSYQPAVPTENLTVSDVLDGLDKVGMNEIPVTSSAEYKKVRSTLDKLRQLESESEANSLIRDLTVKKASDA